MKNADDNSNNRLEQREPYTEERQRKHAARMRILIPVCAACCVALLGLGIWKSGLLRKNPETNSTDNKTVQTTVTPGDRNNSTPTQCETNNTPAPTEPAPAEPTPTDIPLKLETSRELTVSSSGEPVETREMDDSFRAAYEKFAYKLFAQLPEGKTRMISPFSIYVALSMLADGADGDTLAQLDELLGLTAEERNAYLAGWLQKLEGDTSFTNADSVWINEKLKSFVPKDFLDTCAQYFKAAVFSTPMNDSTMDDVNAWVRAKTRNRIDKIMDEISRYTATILTNAITLDAKWEAEFDEERTAKDTAFEKTDGTIKKVDMMYGYLTDGYFENELATGFIKPYKGGEFSYIALLPKRDYDMNMNVSIDQLLASLSPESIRSLMDNKYEGEIYLGVPKYEAEYSIELSDVLKQLGVTDAFDDEKANLSRMVEDLPVYVSKVTHKTYISVDEKGTQAAAVSQVETLWKSMPPQVILNRPFVYMIVDSDGLPVFLGTFEG